MKSTFIALLSLIVLSSCTNDDDKKSHNNPDPGLTLLKRSVETFYNENETIISDYEYNGNRLTKVTLSNDPYYPTGSYELYHYTNNRLSSTEFFIANELTQTRSFEYNSQGRLISLISQIQDGDDIAEKTTYVYNNDGTITIEQYTQYIDGDDSFEELSANGLLTVSNGNIVGYELTYTSGERIIQNFTFDTLNSPFKNVFASEILTLASLEGGVNNILSYNLVQNNEEPSNSSKTIQYNQLNYPITETEPGIKREYTYY